MAEATTEYQIKIFATGGSQASAEVQKVIDSTTGLKQGQNDLISSLQKPAQHVALKTMSDEMLRAIGYTGNMRTASNLLDVAIMKLGGAIKLTTSAIFPYVAILGGVVAILSKVKSAHAESAIASENAAKQLHAQATEYESSKEKIDAYGKSIGVLPQYLRDLKKSLEEATAATTAQMKAASLIKLQEKSKEYEALKIKLSEYKQEVDKITAAYPHMAETGNKAYIENVTGITRLKKEISDLIPKISDLDREMKIITANAISQGKGFADAAAEMEHYKQVAKDAADERDRNKKAQEDAAKASIEASELNSKLLEREYNNSVKNFENFKKNIQNKQREEKEFQQTLREANAMEQALFANEKTGLTVSAVAFTKLKDTASICYNQMMSGMGQAAAKMIVEGEDFGIAMQNVFKSMLESFIAAIIEMTARWLAFQALTAAFGSSSSIVSFISGSHATGVDTLVDRPRLLQVGENGPERVTVTPITGTTGGMVAAGAGGGMNITIPMTINSTANASQLANEVGRKIISQIRGLGQNNFVRGK
jgi:hypothetical protein